MAPALSPVRQLFGLQVRDALSTYTFYNYARVWNGDKLDGERPFNLHTVGVGVRYQLSRHGSLQVAYGWQLRDTGDDSRLHLSARASEALFSDRISRPMKSILNLMPIGLMSVLVASRFRRS